MDTKQYLMTKEVQDGQEESVHDEYAKYMIILEKVLDNSIALRYDD